MHTTLQILKIVKGFEIQVGMEQAEVDDWPRGVRFFASMKVLFGIEIFDQLEKGDTGIRQIPDFLEPGCQLVKLELGFELEEGLEYFEFIELF